MNYKVIGLPTVEPVSLDEARTHLRVEPFGSPLGHPDDTYIQTLITVARDFCEQYLERALATKTIEMVLDDFPKDSIQVPLSPTTSIVSIKYHDASGSEVELPITDYMLDDYATPEWILTVGGAPYPTTDGSINNVKIRMEVGYTNGQSPDTHPLPASIKAAMLLIVANLYENRQQDVLGNTRISFNSLPLGVYNLLQPYRLGLGL